MEGQDRERVQDKKRRIGQVKGSKQEEGKEKVRICKGFKKRREGQDGERVHDKKKRRIGRGKGSRQEEKRRRIERGKTSEKKRRSNIGRGKGSRQEEKEKDRTEKGFKTRRKGEGQDGEMVEEKKNGRSNIGQGKKKSVD